MALAGISLMFRPVSSISILRYKNSNNYFYNTKSFVLVDLYPLFRLSFCFGVI